MFEMTEDLSTRPSMTVLERLALWSERLPEKKAWSFVDDRGEIAETYTYRELEQASSSLAAHLTGACGLTKDSRVLLVFFPGLHFTISLLACFKAGVIAVPVFPPDPTKLAKDLHHFVSIQGNCGASTALTHSPYSFAKKVAALKNIFSSKGLAWPDLQWVAVDDIIAKGKKSKAAAQFSAPLRTDIAFLQYTSGSTSEPKGVMISHGNLAHNEAIIAAELQTTESTICVSWLPQYHDMGLIGSYLGALYCGGSGYYISPISFLKDPVLWVRCMSKFKATHTQAPNFAYALVSRKFKESQQGGKSSSSASMDLRSVQHMINAAEPVDAVAIDIFYRTFERFGLPRGVIVPTYGLAEHTVFVCSGGKKQLIVKKEAIETQYVDVVSENANEYTQSIGGDEKLIESGLQRIVGCGYPKDEYQVTVLIVHAENKSVLGDDKVGEIWVASPSKAMGYWGNEAVTVEEFCAKPNRGWGASSKDIAQDEAYGGYLRTGDEGFLHDGELFICGRIKDLIVIRGTNHYPQDIERTVEGKESRLRPGCTAAFSLASKTDANRAHTESIVYVAEVKEGIDMSIKALEQLAESVRLLVVSEHGIALSTICLIKTRSILKTTSGKIARSWCRRALLENKLEIVYRWDTPILTGKSALDGKGISEANELLTTGAEYEEVSLVTDSERAEVVAAKTAAASELRALALPAIREKLENLLIQISAQSPSPLGSPIEADVPLILLGLDSMTVIQIKGVVEKRFFCTLPDEFLFSQIATLNGISEAVKNGELTPSQRTELARSEAELQSDGAGGRVAPIAKRKEPFCPWWTCCY